MMINKQKGFTLLELLIVIAIISVLAVIIVIVLNPAETLKKARDSQRISDLNTVKTALGLYLSSTTTPYLAADSSNAKCKDTGAITWATTDRIFYSIGSDVTTISDTTLDGGTISAPAAQQVTTAASGGVDSTGWIPVNLDTLSIGAPISNFPIDPVNTVANGASITSADLVYRYVCRANNLTFELDAVLESDQYTVVDNRMAKDGGNNAVYYEVGTNLKILGVGVDF